MIYISIQEMESDPHSYFQRVEAGETIVITRDQRPVAEIKPMRHQASNVRPIGLAAGEFTVPEDFDAALPESILRDFEGQ